MYLFKSLIFLFLTGCGLIWTQHPAGEVDVPSQTRDMDLKAAFRPDKQSLYRLSSWEVAEPDCRKEPLKKYAPYRWIKFVKEGTKTLAKGCRIETACAEEGLPWAFDNEPTDLQGSQTVTHTRTNDGCKAHIQIQAFKSSDDTSKVVINTQKYEIPVAMSPMNCSSEYQSPAYLEKVKGLSQGLDEGSVYCVSSERLELERAGKAP